MNIHQIETGLQEELRKQALALRPVEDEVNLEKEVKEFNFLQEPYLERIAFYKQSMETTLQTLHQNGEIESDTANMFAQYFIGKNEPDKVSLYEHQADAIKSINKGRNVVICTGTGSGKTESFLIPVINAIVKERNECRKNNCEYRAGVRALLLYPMNALVNDQLKRIRKILKGSSVTYGIYTSELKQFDSNYIPFNENQYNDEALGNLRAALRNELFTQLSNLQDNMFEGACHTNSFTDDDVPANEYTSRNQWRAGAADIVITNFAMLEQLLLNPQNNNIFSDTWRFIIVDEAHSYDGGMGTDIAWLLRRVKKATHAENIQCIATSATLIEDSTSETKDKDELKTNQDKQQLSKEEKIKKDFAQELFSEDADTFDVYLGSLYDKKTKRGSATGADYRKMVCADVEKDVINILNKEFSYIKVKQPIDFSLLAMTQWLKNQEKLNALLAGFNPANEMALSDAVIMSQFLSVILPDVELKIQPNNALFNVLGGLIRNAELHLNVSKLIQQVSGIESVNELTKISAIMEKFAANREVAIKCKYLLTIAQVAQELFDSVPNFDASILYKQKVVWTKETAGDLFAISKDITKFGTYISELKRIITQLWNKATGLSSDVIENCVRDYLLLYPHVADLSAAFDKVRNNPELSKRSELIKQVFGDVEDANKQFEALVSLLLLSSHPGLARKPLMDLRYHQIVSGISEMAVSFHVENGKIERRYYSNDSRIVGDANQILYTFGICYKCYQPYILVYCREFNENVRAQVSRYDDGNEETRFYAFSWKPGKTQQNAEHTHILHIKKGEIEQTCRPANENEGELPLYCMAFAELDPERNVRTFIKKCPSCENPSRNKKANYGNIAPYASGVDNMRTIVLHYLAKSADAQCGLGEMLADGRKVLAFSDSREAAARLAINFDTYVEQRLLEDSVYNALSDRNNFFEEFRQYKDFFGCDKKDLWVSLMNMGDSARRAYNRYDEDGTEWEELIRTLSKYRYSDSLHVALPLLTKELENKGALRLFDKAYRQAQDNNKVTYLAYDNKLTSASLLALSALRTDNARSLIKSGNVIVEFAYSINRDAKPYREQLLGELNKDESKFSAIERDVAKQLFLHCELYCKDYDYDNGDNYAADIDASLNGFGGYKKLPLRIDEGGALEEDEDEKTLAWETSRNFQKLVMALGVSAERVTEFLRKFRTYLMMVNVLKEKGGVLLLNLDKIRYVADADNPPSSPIDQYFRIEEHTAQVSKEVAAMNQRNFANGKVNILSCSTTFEMGVDLGDLNCVFMNNLPPKVANYKQRAGRAGRRSGSASYVLTLIGESAHDLYYKEHPHDLFFGSVNMPKFYMQNETFRAKHLRAIALAHFLKENIGGQWRQCQTFFADRAAMPGRAEQPAMVSRLGDWLQTHRNAVQQLCCDIAGVDQLPYSVADDLAYQIAANVEGISEEYKTYFRHNSEKLSGPRIHGNPYSCSVQERYMMKLDALPEAAGNARVRQQKQDLLQELANNRVLPRYGFPCNTISLLPDKNDWYAKSVKLDRPKSIGIFEYAPKQVAIAIKRCFKSVKPLFIPNNQLYYGADRNRTLYYCNHCAEYFSLSGNEAEVCCTMCGRRSRFAQKAAIEPDGFWAGMSESAKSAQYTQPVAKHCIYSGGCVDGLSVGVRNISVAPSATRALLFINPRPFEYRNRQQNIKESLLLMHELQTDMVLWDVSSVCQTMTIRPDWNEERLNNAWESVLQAVLSAVCKKLDISEKDVSGIVVKRPNKRYILLYDNSASGNGSLLPLIPTEQNQDSVKSVVEDILDKAREICESCPKCGTLAAKDKHKKPGTLQQSLLEAENYRPCCACYHCIMRYENQKYHGKLDVHDAAVILKALLGAHPAGPNPDGGNPGPGGVNNTPGDGKQVTDSQYSQKGGALVDATASVVVNRGVGGAASCVAEAGNEVQGQTPNNQRNTYSEREPVAAPPQPFISIEGNFTDKKNMNLSKGKEFWVRKDGRVFVDVLKRVLSDHRAEFNSAGKVAYADIMKK